MARIKRRGEAFYPSSGTLPPTQERVHRLQELDSGRSRTLSDLLTGVWGEAPYQPTTLPRLQSQGFVAPPPPYRRISRPTKPWRLLQRLQIRVPARVRFCQQRKERREVLFSLRIAGRAGGSPGPYRRRAESAWRC